MTDTFNNLESTILRILEAHQGKDFAISRKELVDKINDPEPQFPTNEREIRETIKHLVTQHGQRIGSCSKGYFMIETDQELIEACKYYHGYALSLLYVEARLRNMNLAELLGQLSLELRQ